MIISELSKRDPSLGIVMVSAVSVEKLLLNLNANKTAGPDNLNGKLLMTSLLGTK